MVKFFVKKVFSENCCKNITYNGYKSNKIEVFR